MSNSTINKIIYTKEEVIELCKRAWNSGYHVCNNSHKTGRDLRSLHNATEISWCKENI